MAQWVGALAGDLILDHQDLVEKKKKNMTIHTCNPSIGGNRDRRIAGSSWLLA